MLPAGKSQGPYTTCLLSYIIRNQSSLAWKFQYEFQQDVKALADEHHAYAVRQHFTSPKQCPPCYTRESTGSWVSHLGLELLCSCAGDLQGQLLDEAGGTFGHRKQRGNWVVLATT